MNSAHLQLDGFPEGGINEVEPAALLGTAFLHLKKVVKAKEQQGL